MKGGRGPTWRWAAGRAIGQVGIAVSGVSARRPIASRATPAGHAPLHPSCQGRWAPQGLVLVSSPRVLAFAWPRNPNSRVFHWALVGPTHQTPPSKFPRHTSVRHRLKYTTRFRRAPPVGTVISRVLRSAKLHAGTRTGGSSGPTAAPVSRPLVTVHGGVFPPETRGETTLLIFDVYRRLSRTHACSLLQDTSGRD